MRMVIDLQGAQAGYRNRGIGRYTLALSQAMLRNRGEHEIFLALNGFYPDTIEPIRAAFQDLLPQENIRVWHAHGPVSHADAANAWRRRAAELTREAFLASLSPTVVLVCSLFEGLMDYGVTSIGCLSQTVPTATVLHDLIPLVNRSIYLDDPAVALWYENKLAHLRRSDLLLANSESSRQEGIDYLGFSADSVVNISAAADAQFSVRAIGASRQAELRQRYGIVRPYVLYTGGIDPRKNIEGLIRAYACLPAGLRLTHQLAIVCSMQPQDRSRLEALAKDHGLEQDELMLTGYVPEEDLVALYNLCKVSAFPSWHEGFGLPALEAMACGRAVVGANTSSLPEVIGYPAALFDPFDDASIAGKLEQVLTDEAFRHTLERHGLEQAKNFSWDRSAQTAIAALEGLAARGEATRTMPAKPPQRPRLAYVSPLPPERGDISDYSAELLPELARHYAIDVVVAQDAVTTPWIKANCPIRTVDWFLTHAGRFDRVLYHVGNSNVHQPVFALLQAVPGVVVLHDFFLADSVAHMECHGAAPNGWADALYTGHGYAAVWNRFHAADGEDTVWKYPCNLAVLQNAQGVIVHSDYSRRLARHWYGPHAGRDWSVVPPLRPPARINAQSRSRARAALGLGEDDFVVCSFGLVGPIKLSHRVLDAWLASPLAASEQCALVFVGENESGKYGQNLLQAINQSGFAARIHVTGWADASVFQQYLAAADAGVQLRTGSRGEVSGAVLDCMNYGLATVVNAHASMADLPDDGVWKLPDEFTDAQLAAALSALWRDTGSRRTLGDRARQIIRDRHAPRACADQYFAAIERFQQAAATGVPALTRAIAHSEPASAAPDEWLALAEAIDRSIAPPLTQRQLFVDVSELAQRDAKSGIQRVVRSILQEWLKQPPDGYRVEPVHATADQPGYRYARQFTLGFLGCQADILGDEPIAYYAGDVFVGLDLQPEIAPAQNSVYQAMRRQGVSVQFVVYDLLLLQLPHCFPDVGASFFERWLNVVAQADGAVCISKSVADELATWLEAHGPKRDRPFMLNWFHLGANFDRSVPTAGLPGNASTVIAGLRTRPSFLMVGTVEPRKGHAQALAAFEALWAQGENVNLAIVGKQGWMVDRLAEKLRAHPELGNRLFWLEDISDEFLEKVYAASTCLIAASEGEGFGLPLIEAARHKLPIIARDIPVFREVAGGHAAYFDGKAPGDLAHCIIAWLRLHAAGRHPTSAGMPCLTWAESAKQLIEAVKINRARPTFIVPNPPRDRQYGVSDGD